MEMRSNRVGLDGRYLDLWNPHPNDQYATMALASCLSAAFSSGPWAATPMPIGQREDSDSALGVIRGLGSSPIVVAASAKGDPSTTVLGCVLGCVLDVHTVDGHGLDRFGAEEGDGLLAFFGIRPDLQGAKIRPRNVPGDQEGPRATSFARHLFQAWLDNAALSDCRRLFIRTRHGITPIRHLSESFGFAYCGEFDLRFQGQIQTRLVYRRTNDPGRPS